MNNDNVINKQIYSHSKQLLFSCLERRIFETTMCVRMFVWLSSEMLTRRIKQGFLDICDNN